MRGMSAVAVALLLILAVAGIMIFATNNSAKEPQTTVSMDKNVGTSTTQSKTPAEDLIQTATKNAEEVARSTIIVEAARCENNSLTVYVRNAGNAPATIRKVEIGENYTTVNTEVGSGEQAKVIAEIPCSNLPAGTIVKVWTEDGSEAQGYLS